MCDLRAWGVGMTTIREGISVVITARDEGNLAHRSVRSALRAVRAARQRCRVEMIAVLDCPTAETVAYFERHAADFAQIHRVAYEDRGLARNYGVERARGKYVAFLTTTDLVSENWLAAAHEQAEATGDDCVVFHPQFSLRFGQDPKLYEHPDQREPGFEAWNLFADDCWTGSLFTSRELLLEVPYAPRPRASGWGHADWHWNCEAVAAGARHHTVPGTVHFLRDETNTRSLIRTKAYAPLMQPTRLWDQAVPADALARNSVLSPRKAVGSERLQSLAANLQTRLRAHLHDRPRLRSAAQRIRSAAQAFRAAKASLTVTPAESAPLPEWLVAESRALHDVEPALLPPADLGATISRHQRPSLDAVNVYRQAAELWPSDRTHVFLLPWMRRGGSDLVVLHQMRSVGRTGLRPPTMPDDRTVRLALAVGTAAADHRAGIRQAGRAPQRRNASGRSRSAACSARAEPCALRQLGARLEDLCTSRCGTSFRDAAFRVDVVP